MPSVEVQPRLTTPFIRLVDKVTGRGDTTLLTHADRVNLRRYDKQLKREAKIELKEYAARLDRAFEEDRIMRAKEPKVPKYIEVNGRKFTGLQYFMYLDEQYEQARAVGRGEEYLQSLIADQRFGTGKPLTPEQQREQTRKTIPDITHQMAKEARDAEFDLVAESIQKKIWKKATPVTINPIGQLKIDVEDDASTINRSRFGASISYTHKDIAAARRDKIVRIPQSETLSFGIGYFTDREQIIPEAQQAISDEDLQKGVKAYFVERSYTVEERGRAVRKTEVYAIPFGYQETLHTFFDYLYKSAKLLSPDKVLPLAKRRVRKAA